MCVCGGGYLKLCAPTAVRCEQPDSRQLCLPQDFHGGEWGPPHSLLTGSAVSRALVFCIAAWVAPAQPCPTDTELLCMQLGCCERDKLRPSSAGPPGMGHSEIRQITEVTWSVAASISGTSSSLSADQKKQKVAVFISCGRVS